MGHMELGVEGRAKISSPLTPFTWMVSPWGLCFWVERGCAAGGDG